MPHITQQENKVFGKFSKHVRHTQYARAICRRNADITIKEIMEAVVWKFGNCEISAQEIADILRASRRYHA